MTERAGIATVDDVRTPIGAASGGRWREFRTGWPVVLAAALGSGMGMAGLFTYTAGLFVGDLHEAIGLTRGQFGIAFFGATVAMAVALPFVGRVIDRRGPRAPTMIGAALLAAGFVALGLFTTSIAAYVGLSIAIGLLGAASTPVGYTRAVSGAFVASRGLALGLTQVGIGVAGAVVPPLIAMAIAAHGWRVGYYLLAAIALAGVLPSLVGLRGVQALHGGAAPDAEFRAIRRTRTYRLQMAAFVTMALGFAGMLPHFVPLLRDAGVAPQTAAAYAGLIGVSVIGSRVVIGLLADSFHAPLLAAIACALCMAGCLALALGGARFAVPAALALGCAMGAEADLIGFLTARYFGLAAYGRAYAWQYAAFMLAAGASPAWIGIAADASGGYRAPLLGVCGLLGVAIVLFMRLPPTRDADAPR